jgi:serine protease AprX
VSHHSAHHGPAAVDSALLSAHGRVHIVVQKYVGVRHVDRVVHRLGGRVTQRLSIVHGFAATLPVSAIRTLAHTHGVRAISLDRTLAVQASPMSPSDAGNGNDLPAVFRQVVGADQLAAAGDNGHGVTVALIDTGVTSMSDLSGRLVTVATDPLGLIHANCINFSKEATCNDTYGHGTFIAGLIAGNGNASGGQYAGTATGSKVLSVKLAGADGSADVSQTLAAIQWVVSFKSQYNIKVLNLSLGTDSTQSYHVDPLNFAVERAWAAGLVVVVSASNRGPGAGTIAKPGDDPYVLTVGAVDDRGTPGTGDDRLPNFSSRGPTAADGIAKPDVVAPGAHLVSLNAPGSSIATQFPSGMPAPYRRGSGTSMSAAVVSGAVALMLSAQPAMTPDRVKYALTATARQSASTDPMLVGAGVIDVSGAMSAPAGLANQGLAPSNGLGSIDLSRGTAYVSTSDPVGTVVSGPITSQLLAWDPATLLTADWTGTNWYGTNWYGTNWYGTNWYGTNWYGTNWYGSSFYGEVEGTNWYGTNWYGSAWYGVWE